MNQAGKVAMLDVSNPEQPALLQALDLGEGSGPHFLALTRDGRRLVVTDYFLDEDAAGKVHAEGDHRVHVLRVGERGLEVDPRFRLDFDAAFASGPARPHGVAMK
jgi:selenium-binding protein 1